MRLVTFLRLGEPRLGAVVGEQIIDLNAGYQYLQERAGIPRARERAGETLRFTQGDTFAVPISCGLI